MMDMVLALGLLGIALIAIRTLTLSPVSRRFRRLVLQMAVDDAILRISHPFDRQMRAFTRYWVAVKGLDRALSLRDDVDRKFLTRCSAEQSALVRRTREYAEIIRYYERKRAQCVAYFASMSDAEILEISRLGCETHLANLVPAETLVSFFRGERDLILSAPHMAAGHMERMKMHIIALRDKVSAGLP